MSRHRRRDCHLPGTQTSAGPDVTPVPWQQRAWNPTACEPAPRRMLAQRGRTRAACDGAPCSCDDSSWRKPRRATDSAPEGVVSLAERLAHPSTPTAVVRDDELPVGFFMGSATSPPRREMFSFPTGTKITRIVRSAPVASRLALDARRSSQSAERVGCQCQSCVPGSPNAGSTGPHRPTAERSGSRPDQEPSPRPSRPSPDRRPAAFRPTHPRIDVAGQMRLTGQEPPPPDPPWTEPDLQITRECEVHYPPPPPPPDPLGFAAMGRPSATANHPLLGFADSVPDGSSPASVGGILANEKPLCPPGYHFNYHWQCCLRSNGTVPAELGGKPLHAYACRCPAGYSYVASGQLKGQCWERGKVPTQVRPPAGIGLFWGHDEPVGDDEEPDPNAPKPITCPDGLEYDPELDLCVDNTEKDYCDLSVSIRTWWWDCDGWRDRIHDAATWAAWRLDPAYRMLYQMLFRYYWGGAQGRAWARAMWDYGPEFSSLKGWIGGFSEFRLLLGVRTLARALSKVTDDPWLIICHTNQCGAHPGAGAYTSYGRITLCPAWFDETPAERGQLLLHETLHFCNTLWLVHVMRDSDASICEGGLDDKCYDDENALLLQAHPEIRESVYDQENHVTINTAASVLNTDNWAGWLRKRFLRYGCQSLPSDFPKLYEF